MVEQMNGEQRRVVELIARPRRAYSMKKRLFDSHVRQRGVFVLECFGVGVTRNNSLIFRTVLR